MLYWEGFISKKYWQDATGEDIDTEFPLVAEDVRNLEEYLLPLFWDYNQKGAHYQNRFYFYQWIFIIGAFLTTILATFSAFYGERGQQAFFGWTYLGIFSVSTAIVSAITSYFTVVSNQGEPRKRWASYRRLAEELRMIYFKYLSRTEPFDKPNRLLELRKQVQAMREQEIERG